MLRIALFFVAALASGCTVVGHERVEGWPELRVVEHYVPHLQMRDRCARYVAFGMAPEACAEFYLARGECHLWFSSEFPPSRAAIKHERMHCAGYDHVGQQTMERMLARYRIAAAASGDPQ